YLSVIYKLFYLAINGYSLKLHISLYSVGYNIHMFSYFTVLSNLLCFLVISYYLIKIPFSYAKSKKNSEVFDSTSLYTYKFRFVNGMALMSIILTFALFHFVIARYKYAIAAKGFLALPPKDLYAHYLVPMLFTLDWILFTPKKGYSRKTPLLWLLYPLTYFISIIIRAFLLPKHSIFKLNTFPYFFFNIHKMGIYRFIGIIIALMIVFLIVGYAILGIEKYLNNLCIRSAQKHSDS
ncbi:MAG: Pr6Pr family membrane protein, partial [Lachnospiraceae bacterium]|nr:Pr6Pr family membrane protein [Lachnospiraceae bacterium]